MAFKFLDRWILQALIESGNKIVEQAKSNASWSREIPKAISLGEAVTTPKGFEVAIRLDISEQHGVPYAAAFEFGSGIHATKGTPGTYKIRPKNKKALAFQWNPANPVGALMSEKVIDYIPEDDRWIFRYVDHPGVESRAFIRPAIESVKPSVKTSLLAALRKGFRESIGARIEVIK